MKLFYQLLCGDCSSKYPLTTTEWFLVFICLAILVSLFLPNLHSVALVSFLGAIMAVGYCTILWVVFVAKGRVDDVVYDPSDAVTSEASRVRSILNALGIIAVVFRGHNVVLEIQKPFPVVAVLVVVVDCVVVIFAVVVVLSSSSLLSCPSSFDYVVPSGPVLYSSCLVATDPPCIRFIHSDWGLVGLELVIFV
ncbi:lysine histidine transporter-like 8 protein [Tanacetum coccineum]